MTMGATTDGLTAIMAKRPLQYAQFILFLCLTGLCFVSAAAADKSSPRDRDAYLKSLGLDRNYHECVSVADGDTITLEGLGTVRLIGVDTPEKNHPKLPIQYLSGQAGEFTEALCIGKKVRLEYDFGDKDLRGNYGRLLGFAYLEDGTFLQEALIKNGLAIAYTKYPFDDAKREEFLAWEQQARDRGVGLWRDAGLAEVNWILSQGHPLLQMKPTADGFWEIIFGNWNSGKITPGDVEKKVGPLYAAIYEFSARDLLAWLEDRQYQQTLQSLPLTDNIFIIGMSHRKWGIIYSNAARPGIEQGSLDRELAKLKDLIFPGDPQKQSFALIKGGFYKIQAEVPDRETRSKTARKFLTPDAIVANNETIIPWDLAAGHVGEHATVEGSVSRTFNSGKACFLNFHNNWTRYFSLVIFENVFHRFEMKPEVYYLNKKIRVTGKIKLYRGRPEMVVNHPDQIRIISRQ